MTRPGYRAVIRSVTWKNIEELAEKTNIPVALLTRDFTKAFKDGRPLKVMYYEKMEE